MLNLVVQGMDHIHDNPLGAFVDHQDVGNAIVPLVPALQSRKGDAKGDAKGSVLFGNPFSDNLSDPIRFVLAETAKVGQRHVGVLLRDKLQPWRKCTVMIVVVDDALKLAGRVDEGLHEGIRRLVVDAHIVGRGQDGWLQQRQIVGVAKVPCHIHAIHGFIRLGSTLTRCRTPDSKGLKECFLTRIQVWVILGSPCLNGPNNVGPLNVALVHYVNRCT